MAAKTKKDDAPVVDQTADTADTPVEVSPPQSEPRKARDASAGVPANSTFAERAKARNKRVGRDGSVSK